MPVLILGLLAFTVLWPLWFTVDGALMASDELTAALGPALLDTADGGYAVWTILPSWPTLQPLAELLLDTPQFFSVFWNTCLLAFAQIAGQLVVAAPASWAFAKLRFAGRRFLLLGYIALMVLPFQVLMVPNYLIATRLGIYDTPLSVILPGVFSAFPVFIMTRSFQDVPNELLEAAKLDGATAWQIFWKIGVPLGYAGIFAALVLNFIEGWNAVEQPLLFLKSQSNWPLSMYMNDIVTDNLGIAMAASLLSLIPAMLVFLYGQTYLELGIQAGGIKAYAQQFDRMVEEGVVSTRGLKPDAYVFDELVFDVNTDYFETHGGYEYAKQFYAKVYELAKKIAGGEQYIISAVMHADERNREASDRLGRDVFHYHLHVVYLPVVEKQIRWSKRCKDPALRGTVRETIMQVSHSKKWPMVPMTNEQGQPVLKKNGKPRLVSSYSLLQTEFFEHMRQAGFTDFERGIKGSDAEHLNVLEYKVQKDRQTVAELSDQTKQLQGKRKELISQVKNISGSIRDVADIEQRAKTKGVLEKRVELPVQDFQTLCKMAKASGKLQAENRSLWMQLQQSTVREQELGQRLRRCEEQLDAVLTETRPYREAVRVAPEQVQAFVLGICRRQQEEKRLNRQQRRQRAKGQDR